MRLVAALGGNALGPPDHTDATRDLVRDSVEELAELVVGGHELILTHGNGPQVGELMLDQEARGPDRAARLPLDVLVAMTQAQLGYLIQQALEDALVARGDHTDVVTVVTEVVVDPEDPEFAAPTKPVGPWHDVRPAGGEHVQGPDGRWRRVVPSPAPLHLVERAALRAIVEDGIVPVCGGGGGVPVVRDAPDRLRGVEAVVDKDATSALVARELDAEVLLILTDVDHVERRHGTPDAEPIAQMDVDEAGDLLDSLPAGSMRPKVAAARDAAAEGRTAVIARLGRAAEALRGETGTRILPR